MKDEALNNRAKIQNIKHALDLGCITYEEAREMANPIIDDINNKAKELAKKYNTKPQYVNFMAIMR